MDTFRILVTGTRHNSPQIESLVRHILNELIHTERAPLHRAVVVVHGRCPQGGVDLYADQWARAQGFQVEPHPADWDRHGRRAGPVRNSHMVSTHPDYCLGFPAPGSRGTWDCLQKAVNAGIPTEVHVIGEHLVSTGGR